MTKFVRMLVDEDIEKGKIKGKEEQATDTAIKAIEMRLDNYICVTRPRRFGKSSVADMIGTYYSKAVDSKYIIHVL
ncbi:hypothetical protein [Clostridium uliginosum]|uniref:AAA-ATPase-like domain-containing protein n=1 Tax=Clostridium uliginosum TaxID=119641 RepID=A0A1I1SGS1_9CLOT|nr:hypothetical protein SAMN05421842_1522 [Clostridium uliginosum]